MPTTTMTSREFNQDTGRAKKAAISGPVIITDRGEPSHVLLSIDEYRRLTGTRPLPHAGKLPPGVLSSAEALAQKDEGADFDFDPPKLLSYPRPADLE